ncbi:MAG: polysaccharide deacetylase family protein [Sphingobium sp.]
MFGRLVDKFTRSAILMYHRVAVVEHDPWGLSVSPENFALQLKALRRRGPVLPLEEFASRLAAGTLPSRATAISFDDGYHDNLAQAAPLLAAEGMVATLFLSTGPSRAGRGYWFEDLAELILDAPDAFDGRIGIGGHETSLHWGEREEADDNRAGWRAWDEPRTRREALFYQLWDLIRVLPPASQTATLETLAGLLARAPEREARPMTVEEVRAIAQGPFAIGGHTVDHVDLLTLDDAGALDQMVRGREEAEAMSGARVKGFAYPYGRYDARVADLAKRAGYDWACTTEHRHIGRRGAPLMLLPRLSPEDMGNIGWMR